MASAKRNCWEEKRCGREPGGARAAELGPCPAATDASCDGINDGTNAGRLCWAVTGSRCGAETEGAFVEKLRRCEDCSFFRRVKCEEGCHFQLLRPGLGVSDPAELHRLLNSVASMLSVTRDILGLLAEGPLLRHIVEHALAVTGSSAACVYLFSDSGDELVLAARAGSLARPERVTLGESCAVAEAARTKRFAAAPAGGTESANAAAVPVGGHERLAGVLELVKDAPFSTDDQWFLHEFALGAALGIGNARLVDDLRQLRRFDKAKSRFVALLMHHISSPLATIACSLQAISQLGEKLRDEDRTKLLEVSLERIGSVQDLSRRLLDLAAIRSGRSLGQLRAVPIADALRQEVENRLARAREQGTELVLDRQAGAPVVRADPDGLRVIFANLLDNALKYTTGTVRKVNVALSVERGRVRAEVRDTGIGIPREDQSRIFEEFHRAGNIASARARGHGLGLAVVRELVDRYGGHIELESTVGVGTCIAVVFPLLPPSES
ncbi:MAG TPA: GAF domain-containing sensor histidine kinase [Planctomycetota bacterium]|nr:GAF domain-containing sensor histidine kinase [Planctomycetota bacterium]